MASLKRLCSWRFLAALPYTLLLVVVRAQAHEHAIDRSNGLIAQAARQFDIPPSWIRDVMQRESGGRTWLNGKPITSTSGAMGLMQIMPETWAYLRSRYGLGATPTIHMTMSLAAPHSCVSSTTGTAIQLSSPPIMPARCGSTRFCGALRRFRRRHAPIWRSSRRPPPARHLCRRTPGRPVCSSFLGYPGQILRRWRAPAFRCYGYHSYHPLPPGTSRTRPMASVPDEQGLAREKNLTVQRRICWAFCSLPVSLAGS
jgi:hypothetical protein